MSEVSRDLERWLPVVGFEGYYEVSDSGDVRSVDRIVSVRRNGGVWPRRVRGRNLRTRSMIEPYLPYRTVELARDGKCSTHLVHRLVLEAFLCAPPPRTEACHNDGDPQNNCLNNLRWDSRSSNQKDCVRHGTHAMSKRVACPYGHCLVAPNLVKNQSGRVCLACSRMRARATTARKNGLPFDRQLISDQYYEQIMRIAA